MEISFNNDTYFFNMESQQLKLDKSINKKISNDIISFSITEELGKIVTGNLSIRDVNNIYSRIFRNGMKFRITYGYKDWNQLFNKLSIKNSSGKRQGIDCVAMTPSGSGSESGEVVYNITFYGLELLKTGKNKIYESGKLGDIISILMDDLQVEKKIINFTAQNTKITQENPVRQIESPFKLLKILSIKNKCLFQLGNDDTGKKIGIFIDNAKVVSSDAKDYLKKVIKSGDAKELYYNYQDKSNVKSYTWQHHIGESGQGDNVRLQYIGGKYILTQYVAETEKIQTYELVPERIKQKYGEKTNFSEKLSLMLNYLSQENFESVKWAFKPINETTAPQGVGFTINVAMQGDPSLTVMQQIYFKSGFAAPLTQNQKFIKILEFFIKKATHVISKAGYTTDLEICDVYNLTGTFLKVQKGDYF